MWNNTRRARAAHAPRTPCVPINRRAGRPHLRRRSTRRPSSRRWCRRRASASDAPPPPSPRAARSVAPDNRNKGTDNRNKGTDNRNKGMDNRSSAASSISASGKVCRTHARLRSADSSVPLAPICSGPGGRAPDGPPEREYSEYPRCSFAPAGLGVGVGQGQGHVREGPHRPPRRHREMEGLRRQPAS